MQAAEHLRQNMVCPYSMIATIALSPYFANTIGDE